MSGRQEGLFELAGRARALFTTRADGNLSLSAGTGCEDAPMRRDRLSGELALRWLCAGPQEHGTRVNVVGELRGSAGQPTEQAADGHATALEHVGVMVLAADCVPVALASAGAVAVVHAGWRGLAAGVLGEGVRAVAALAPGEPVDAVIGPCAGRCCYEVGPDVHAALHGAPGIRAKVDLRAMAREQLQAAGVRSVDEVDACTICDERYFSHRREGAEAGRQAVIAWLS